eukprot:TRINITY_DN2634_c2_g2_i1.p1 TRINITY_DN2634_c2_g2~~TRINITY_DN2634_c2_g2_i1.p1  ORF type:complete len:280 (-),score=39.15 TRINITY_DN2634_c2_g2_i1:457-1245(-)
MDPTSTQISTPFATDLLGRFQRNGLMRLPPDEFMLVIRQMGATFSAKECRGVVKHVGTDAHGFVNIHAFCAWFENIENELRLAQSAQNSSASAATGRVAQDDSVLDAHRRQHQHANFATGNAFENVPQLEPHGEDAYGGPQNPLDPEAELGVDVDDRNADGEGEEVDDRVDDQHEHQVQQPRRQPLPHSVQFSQEVHSSDGSSALLGSEGEDKYTLPSHRKLSEREKLMASFRSDLEEVKARLESAPIEYRADVARTPFSSQ